MVPALRSNPQYPRIRGALRRAAGIAKPWQGKFFRCASPEWARSEALVDGEGSRHFGGRWNRPGGTLVVYGSLTPEAALAESLANSRRLGIRDADVMPRVIAAAEAELSKVLDLTEPATLERLRLDLRDLLDPDWQAAVADGFECVSQAVGRAAASVGMEGMLVPSKISAAAVNLVVFPENLGRGCRLRARGLDSSLGRRLPGR